MSEIAGFRHSEAICEVLECDSPAFGGDARVLGRCVGEVAPDLPANRWIGIEEPYDVGDPGCVIVWWHFHCYSKGYVIFIQRAMVSARKESHTSQVPEFSLRLRLLVTSFPARMSHSNWSSLAAALFNAC
jgi:hypothetical protein